MRRHLPESAHGLIRARFVTLVNRKDLRLAERFATGPADEEALAAAYVANRAYVRALLAYRRAGKTPPAEELAAWTARAGKRSLARAMLLAAAGDHAGAAKILRLLAFGESKNLRALIELARSAVALGRLDEARQAVTRVDQLRPQVLELAGLRKRLASK